MLPIEKILHMKHVIHLRTKALPEASFGKGFFMDKEIVCVKRLWVKVF